MSRDEPTATSAPSHDDTAPLLDVHGLTRSYAAPGLAWRTRRTPALVDVSFRLHRGEALAVVGESGSGKSTLARLLLRLETPDAGGMRLDGVDVRAGVALPAWRRRVQMVFQDPFSSLNPMKSVGAHLEGPLVRLAGVARGEWRAQALALLDTVGLTPAGEMIDRRPHELSGGQRQRVAIARALAAKPDVLVADEPTSMLDVSLRVGVLDVLEKLKLEHGLALVLITHDLAAARRLADRVLVMYRGRVVEEGPFEDVLRTPVHPYTQSLVAAVDSLEAPPGPTLPNATSTACPYTTRCCHAWQRCAEVEPVLLACGAGRQARCHLVEQGLAPHGLFRLPHAKQGTS